MEGFEVSYQPNWLADEEQVRFTNPRPSQWRDGLSARQLTFKFLHKLPLLFWNFISTHQIITWADTSFYFRLQKSSVVLPPFRNFFKKISLFRPLFLYFHLFNTVDSTENFLMTGFETRIRGVGSDRSTNWATTTARHFETLDGSWRCFWDLVGWRNED